MKISPYKPTKAECIYMLHCCTSVTGFVTPIATHYIGIVWQQQFYVGYTARGTVWSYGEGFTALLTIGISWQFYGCFQVTLLCVGI